MTSFRKSIPEICAAALFALSGFAADAPEVKWSAGVRAENGEVKTEGKIVNRYIKGDLKVEDGILQLDHSAESGKRTGNMMVVQDPAVLAPGGVIVGEYRGAMVSPGETPDTPVFNLYLSGTAGEGKPVYGGSTKITASGIVTDAGKYAPAGFDPSEMHTLRATLDTATGSYTLTVDGKPAIKGRFRLAKGNPTVWFGDGSRKVNGRARIEYLKLGKLAE